MKIKRLVEQHLITFAGGAPVVDADKYNCTLLAENSDYYVYEIHDSKTARALGKGTDWGIADDDDTIAKQEWINLFKTKCVIAAPDGKSEYFTPAEKVIFFIPKPPFKEKPYMLTIGSYQHGEPDKIPPFQFTTYEDMIDDANAIPPNVNFPIINIDGIRVSKRRADDGQVIEDGELIDVGSERKELVIPKGVVEIDERAAFYRNFLKYVECPESLRSINNFAFSNCNALETVIFNDGLQTIGNGAFSMCYHLSTVRLPDTVKSLGETVFFNCTLLHTITIPGSIETIQRSTFEFDTHLKKITLGEGIKNIKVDAFRGCSSLETLTLPNSLQNIYGHAFEDCHSLKELYLGPNIEMIDGTAFNGCESLKKVVLPSSIVELPVNIFYGCNNLTTIYYDGTIAEWRRIKKNPGWNFLCPDIMVHCINGIEIVEK